MTITGIALIAVIALGWVMAATIGTWAYFASEPLAKSQSESDS